jgi:hypothetical protein
MPEVTIEELRRRCEELVDRAARGERIASRTAILDLRGRVRWDGDLGSSRRGRT